MYKSMMPKLTFIAALGLLAACTTAPAGGQSADAGMRPVLPTGVEQYSRTLWVLPEDQPGGPYFRMENDEITGVAHMVMHDELVNGADLTLQLDTIPGLSAARQIDFSFSPGHQGMPAAHYDITVELAPR